MMSKVVFWFTLGLCILAVPLSAPSGDFPPSTFPFTFFPASPALYEVYPAWKIPYGETILEVSQSMGVDPFLVTALMVTESGFQADAISSQGAVGLLQVVPRHFSLACEELLDPEWNIFVGTAWLHELLKDTGGNVVLTLAMYNAGKGKVRRYNGIPPFRETYHHIQRTLGYYERLIRYALDTPEPGFRLHPAQKEKTRLAFHRQILHPPLP